MPIYGTAIKRSRPTYRKRYGKNKTNSRGYYTSKRKRYSRPFKTLRRGWKNPMASRASYKFTYNDLNFGVGLTSVGGYNGVYEYRINSLYDPDKTGVGVQPYGYDQLVGAGGSSLFSAYRVFASKIRLYINRLVTNPSTTNDNATIRVAIVPWRDESFTYTSFDDVLRLTGVKAMNYRGTDDTKNNKLMCYAKVKSLFPLGINSENLWAYYNATPSAPCVWRVYVDGSSTLTADSTLNWDVKIDYYAKLWKLQPVNES